MASAKLNTTASEKKYRTTEEVIYVEEKSKNLPAKAHKTLIVGMHGMYIILRSLYSFAKFKKGCLIVRLCAPTRGALA